MTNQPAPSDTPRTKQHARSLEWWRDCFVTDEQLFLVDAREVENMERELTRLSAEREKERDTPTLFPTLQDEIKALHATLAERDRQLAEAKQQIDIMKDMIYERGGQIDALRAELAMATDAANKGDETRCNAGAMQDMIDDLQRQKAELVTVVQLAYRKHHLDDPDIGWNELSDKLCDALCNAMTDQGFQAWLRTLLHHE